MVVLLSTLPVLFCTIKLLIISTTFEKDNLTEKLCSSEASAHQYSKGF